MAANLDLATRIGSVVPAFGGGRSTPPFTAKDHQAPRYIVGNALAGDTIAVCNFLDPGDGTGIAAALLAAQSAGVPRTDVFVRSGTYTLNFTLDVWQSTRLWGAGRGQTILVGNNAHRQVIAVNWADTSYPTVLQDFTIRMAPPVAWATGAEVLSLCETTCLNVHVVFDEGRGEPVPDSITAVFRWTGGFEDRSSTENCSVTNAPSNTSFGLPGTVSCFDTEGSNTTAEPQGFFGCRTTGGDIAFRGAGIVTYVSTSSRGVALVGIDQRTTVGSTMQNCFVELTMRNAVSPIAAFRWSGDYIYDSSTLGCTAVYVVDEGALSTMVAFTATAGQNNAASNNTGLGFAIGIDVGAGFDATRVIANGLRNGGAVLVDAGTNTEAAHNVLC